MKTKIVFVGLMVAVVSGCWTVSETEFPTYSVTPVPAGKQIKVKLSNYRSNTYQYVPVEGHESMSAATLAELTSEDKNASWGLRGTPSGQLSKRAVAELKHSGYKIDSAHPQYIIDVSFAGPVYPEYDAMRQLGWSLCTLLTSDRDEVTWTAQLKVLDASNDKVLYRKDLTQKYEIKVWGPIPILSPAMCSKVACPAANSWALTALADAALADATAFIAKTAK